MIAEKLATMPEGRPKKTPKNLGVSQTDAATMLNVSHTSVEQARKVRTEAVPEVAAAVESGKVSVSAAATLAEAPPEKQREVIAKDDKKAILAASKEIRKEMSEERRTKRTQKIVEAVQNNKPLDGSLGTFAVIYADPPWVYDSSESDNRVVENHYPTMTLDDICTLDVNSIAHDDAVLFLWTTSPKLNEAFQVLEAWGFEYRTCAVWDKEKIGMGYYFRQQHELLFVATRGTIPTPAAEHRPSSVIRSPREEHSRKPECVYEIIETMYPQLPKIELFARNVRPGWSRWGNQS
jgi:N6-adenosine-specific RNA methylase IME4/DNA-binding transcriptional regulator YdaS (Cro superfamily)